MVWLCGFRALCTRSGEPTRLRNAAPCRCPPRPRPQPAPLGTGDPAHAAAWTRSTLPKGIFSLSGTSALSTFKMTTKLYFKISRCLPGTLSWKGTNSDQRCPCPVAGPSRSSLGPRGEQDPNPGAAVSQLPPRGRPVMKSPAKTTEGGGAAGGGAWGWTRCGDAGWGGARTLQADWAFMGVGNAVLVANGVSSLRPRMALHAARRTI